MEIFYKVEALKDVQDNGVRYPKGKRFMMEKSLAEAHEKAGAVQIIAALKEEPVEPAE